MGWGFAVGDRVGPGRRGAAATLRPPTPATHPRDIPLAPIELLSDTANHTPSGSVRFEPNAMVQTSDGSLIARMAPLTISVQPLLTFLNQSPDGCPTVLVRAGIVKAPSPGSATAGDLMSDRASCSTSSEDKARRRSRRRGAGAGPDRARGRDAAGPADRLASQFVLRRRGPGASPAVSGVLAVSGRPDRGSALRLSVRPAGAVCVRRGRSDVPRRRGVQQRERSIPHASPRLTRARAGPHDHVPRRGASRRAAFPRRLRGPGRHHPLADGRLGRAGQCHRVQPSGGLVLAHGTGIDLRHAGGDVGRPRLGLRRPPGGDVPQPDPPGARRGPTSVRLSRLTYFLAGVSTLFRSQTKPVKSMPAEASLRPSDDTDTALTPLRCPRSVARTAAVAAS